MHLLSLIIKNKEPTLNNRQAKNKAQADQYVESGLPTYSLVIQGKVVRLMSEQQLISTSQTADRSITVSSEVESIQTKRKMTIESIGCEQSSGRQLGAHRQLDLGCDWSEGVK